MPSPSSNPSSANPAGRGWRSWRNSAHQVAATRQVSSTECVKSRSDSHPMAGISSRLAAAHSAARSGIRGRAVRHTSTSVRPSSMNFRLDKASTLGPSRANHPACSHVYSGGWLP